MRALLREDCAHRTGRARDVSLPTVSAEITHLDFKKYFDILFGKVIRMPSRATHKRWSWWLLGDDHDEVHEWIDRPVKRYPGRKHREYRHSLLEALIGGCQQARRKKKSCASGASAGILHIFQDFLFTTAKSKKKR